MSTTVKALTAAKPHHCESCGFTASLRGIATIAVGHRYLRHVAFPGDESNHSDRPWVAKECIACAEQRSPGMGLFLADACARFCCGDIPCALPGRHDGKHSCRRCVEEAAR